MWNIQYFEVFLPVLYRILERSALFYRVRMELFVDYYYSALAAALQRPGVVRVVSHHRDLIIVKIHLVA
jgi:hypothetical protein